MGCVQEIPGENEISFFHPSSKVEAETESETIFNPNCKCSIPNIYTDNAYCIFYPNLPKTTTPAAQGTPPREENF